MNDREQRSATCARCQQPAGVGGGRGIQIRRRLICQDQGCPLHQHAGDRDFLALASGEPIRPLIGALPQTDGVQRIECLLDIAGQVTARPTAPAWQASQRTDHHVVQGAEALDEMQALEHLGNLLSKRSQLGWAIQTDAQPQDFHLAFCAWHEAAQAAKERGLSGAVGPDDGHALPARNPQRGDGQQNATIEGLAAEVPYEDGG